jgi:coenzyme F420-dependent glucose-6-phosphate dehydrogenase
MKFAWLCSHESYQPEELVKQAVLAEQAGFDVVLGSDHFHPWVDDVSAASFVWSWLGAVAAQTQRVELGTSVTCPLFHYHPGMIAQAAATVDRLSDGRFFLGVGTGEAINETPLGWDFPGYGERIARLAEALEIIDRLQAGEKLSFTGKHYSTQCAKLYSPPVHRMPILMAANGPKSAAFAGAHADGIITSVKDPQVTRADVIEPFSAAAKQSGRTGTPLILATRWCVLATDEGEAWAALASMRGLRAPGRLEAVDPAVLRERADAMERTAILGQYARATSAEELVEVYRPLVTEIGADYVSIQVASTNPEGAIKLIGDRVLPALRELSGA